MKVIIHQDCSSAIGLINAYLKRSDEVALWHPSVKPAFDLWYELKPDLFICDLDNVDKSIIKVLQKYKTPAIITLPVYSSSRPQGVLNATIRQRGLAREVSGGNTHFISFFDGYLDKWEDSVPTPFDMPYDSTIYYRGKVREEFKCHVAIVEDYQPLYKKFYDRLKALGQSIKIYANGWNVPECVGRVDEVDMKDVYISADETLLFAPLTSLAYNCNASGGTPLVVTNILKDDGEYTELDYGNYQFNHLIEDLDKLVGVAVAKG